LSVVTPVTTGSIGQNNNVADQHPDILQKMIAVAFITLIYPLNKVKFKISKSRTSKDFINHLRSIKHYVKTNKVTRFILVIDNASFHVSRKTERFIEEKQSLVRNSLPQIEHLNVPSVIVYSYILYPIFLRNCFLSSTSPSVSIPFDLNPSTTPSIALPCSVLQHTELLQAAFVDQ
jgi:hypothetical protein